MWGPSGTRAPDRRRRGLGRALRSSSVGVGHEILGLAWRDRAERAEVLGSGSWGVSKVRGCRRPWKRV